MVSGTIGVPNSADLGFAPIVEALNIDGRHARFLEATLGALITDREIIAYRQAALAELLVRPTLAQQLTEVLPQLHALAEGGPTARWRDNAPLPLVGARLADLSAYVQCVEHLWHATNSVTPPLQAPAWQNLHMLLANLRADHEYVHLAQHLPELRAQFERAGSITLGINLDSQLQPESATVLAINIERVSSKGGVIERLLGERYATDALRGITALYKSSEGPRNLPEHELFRDLTRLLERIATPVTAALERYTRLNSAPLVSLIPEVVFYLGALRLKGRLDERGVPTVLPTFATEQQTTQVSGACSIELALRSTAGQTIIRNDICFSSDEQIALLTGPNSGGKTTYARAIAQAHAMFQAGLFVAGDAARIAPVNGIFSHFATAERASGNGGRLAEELERCAAILHHATPASLIIFNEPFTSTDTQSARTISHDIIAGIQLLGARTVYITHLQELVNDLVEDSASARGIVFLIAEAEGQNERQHESPTYRIVRGRPQPSTFARELARQYGLDRTQLEQQISQRFAKS